MKGNITMEHKSPKKQAQIKCATTPEFKQEVQAFLKKHNLTESALVMSSIQATMDTYDISDVPADKTYADMVQKHLQLNTIMNIIKKNPQFPESTKSKIIKELERYV